MPRWELAGETKDGSPATVVVSVADDGRTVLDIDPPGPVALNAMSTERLRAALGEARGTPSPTEPKR